MPDYKITVVIPTRNRPESVKRILNDLEGQTLASAEFEVLLVDDGSEPPLDFVLRGSHFLYSLKILRRTTDHGAHASRFSGLRHATGNRVLFLDDDVVLSPDLLAEHAGVANDFAIGPILYHPDSTRTPYQRFQAARYAEYATTCESQGQDIDLTSLYICNSSGPTTLYLEVFQALADSYAGTHMAGDGFDEELICLELLNHKRSVAFLKNGFVLHVDNKTTAEACRERTLHGKLVCRFLFDFPSIKHEIGAYHVLTGGATSRKTWRTKLFWAAPFPFNFAAKIFTAVADHGPNRWVPSWVCKFAMSVAFWEGMRSAAPSFRSFRARLLEPCTGK